MSILLPVLAGESYPVFMGSWLFRRIESE